MLKEAKKDEPFFDKTDNLALSELRKDVERISKCG